jgi:hypothetical protein
MGEGSLKATQPKSVPSVQIGVKVPPGRQQHQN